MLRRFWLNSQEKRRAKALYCMGRERRGYGPDGCAERARVTAEKPTKKKSSRRCWTQRTEKPLARLFQLSGFTLPELKFKLPALLSPARRDDEDQ